MEKPDEQTLETIAENFCSNYCSVHSRFDDIQRDYFKSGFNYVWSSHVEPLQKENEELTKWKTDAEVVLIEAGKSIGILSKERDKLKSELLTRDAVWLPAKDAEIDKLKSENERLEAEIVRNNLDSFEGYKKMQSEIDSLKEQLKQYTEPNTNVKTE